jgi:hypothetical protein
MLVASASTGFAMPAGLASTLAELIGHPIPTPTAHAHHGFHYPPATSSSLRYATPLTVGSKTTYASSSTAYASLIPNATYTTYSKIGAKVSDAGVEYGQAAYQSQWANVSPLQYNYYKRSTNLPSSTLTSRSRRSRPRGLRPRSRRPSSSSQVPTTPPTRPRHRTSSPSRATLFGEWEVRRIR